MGRRPLGPGSPLRPGRNGGRGSVPPPVSRGLRRDCADHTMAYCCPHGMIGTVDSELCGEPSMILSLIAR